MIPFQLSSGLNTDNYFIPESWEEVKYNRYAEYLEVHQNEELASYEKAAQIVSILTQIPLETIHEAGFELVNKLMERLKFINSKPEVKPITHVAINGTTYHAQELRAFGELVAFDKMETVFQQAPMSKIPRILAILLRKAIEMPAAAEKPSIWAKLLRKKPVAQEQELLYEVYPNDFNWLEKRAKLFETQLNAVEVMSLAAFFLSKEHVSQLPITSFSPKELRIQLVKASLEAISTVNTAGKPLYRLWQKTLQHTGKFLIFALEKY